MPVARERDSLVDPGGPFEAEVPALRAERAIERGGGDAAGLISRRLTGLRRRIAGDPAMQVLRVGRAAGRTLIENRLGRGWCRHGHYRTVGMIQAVVADRADQEPAESDMLTGTDNQELRVS